MAATNTHPELAHIFAVPNGGKRGKAQAGKLKAEGVKAGMLDLILPVAVGGKHGLFLEMKAAGGRLTHEQKGWIDYLRGAGYAAAVAHGFDAARAVLVAYLATGRTA